MTFTHQHQHMTLLRMAGVGLALFATILYAGRVHAEDYTRTFSVAERASVHIDTNDGSVSVTTGEAKQVEVRVEYQGYQLDKTLHIDASQQGDRITLTARTADRTGVFFSWGNRRLHIEVRMPKDADLSVETGDGSVQAAALAGNITVYTHDGSIRASHLSGSIDLRSGDGSIDVDSLTGEVHLRTGDGSIEGGDLDGKFAAESGDGRIRLAGRFDALQVKTGDGSIDARVLPGSKVSGAWNIHTGSGSVDMTLPGNLQVDIDATTGDGHIDIGFPVGLEGTVSKSQVHGKMNGGGPTLTIHTGDGSIHLQQA
jgi:DUF4097 and DUF4098 domain-containing protein YvlB